MQWRAGLRRSLLILQMKAICWPHCVSDQPQALPKASVKLAATHSSDGNLLLGSSWGAMPASR
jgi:hypothetical protein